MFGKRNDKSETRRISEKIVIASAGRGAGVSFVAMLLAEGLKKYGSVTVCELGLGSFYNSLGFEYHFLSSGFVDFYKKLRDGEHIECSSNKRIGEANIFDGINWFVRNSGDDVDLSMPEIFRALNIPQDEFCIFDCSGLDHDIARQLLADADFPVVVVDPLPSKLIESIEFLEKIRISLPGALIVVNKMNKGVHLAELNRFLGTKDYFSLASVPPEYIYKAEYNRVSICDISGASDYLTKAQDMLCHIFL